MPANQIPIHTEQSVRLTSHNGILVREDTAFTNQKGVEKRGIRKRAELVLDKLQEPLRKFLEPDEAVLYLARGQLMPGGIEQMLLGWHAYFLAPAVLVLTNRRLLHLLVTQNGGWEKSVRSARWGDLEEARIKGLLSFSLRIKYRGGDKEVYWHLLGEDAKKIQVLLDVLLLPASGETSPTLTMTSRCPECRTVLTPRVYECPNCRLQFKDEKTALIRSILIPGGGFFYSGHPYLGLLHGLTDLVLIFIAAFWVMAALGISQTEPAPHAQSGAVVAVVVLLTALAFHKWMLVRVSRKLVRNYIPVL